MKATTEKTLTALAEVKTDSSVRLSLDPELYPSVSRAAAAEAFSGLCHLRQLPEEAVTVSLVNPAPEGGRQVIGEFLNFILGHAVKQRVDSEEIE